MRMRPRFLLSVQQQPVWLRAWKALSEALRWQMRGSLCIARRCQTPAAGMEQAAEARVPTELRGPSSFPRRGSEGPSGPRPTRRAPFALFLRKAGNHFTGARGAEPIGSLTPERSGATGSLRSGGGTTRSLRSGVSKRGQAYLEGSRGLEGEREAD
ncbi:hypothetical protein GW7_01801 [Heterocephalus glaber]|uniref:Uncharacterized protein n=1 Tax=Heterocephalus glaber TaxID=10181 RepID=G5B9H0_HETGA|nr:hypothetical protein GW7_01801 [Heterocephalus glaber]